MHLQVKTTDVKGMLGLLVDVSIASLFAPAKRYAIFTMSTKTFNCVLIATAH